MTKRWVLAGLGLLACNVGVDGGNSGLSAGMSGPGSSATATVGSNTEGSPTSAGTASDGSTVGGPGGSGPDGTEADASATMGPDTDDGTTTIDPTTSTGDAPGDPLDPDLDVPEGGEPCVIPGNLQECPGIQVCRFHTTEQGLCESCDACGNLGAFCVEGTDCDILFACYLGQCTNFCMLGSFECGPPEDCLDIGHPTHGVCAP